MNTRISNLAYQNLVTCDGVINYHPQFFDVTSADMIFQQLETQLDWHQEVLKIMGKEVIAPRLVCWYGENNAVYTYSGITHKPAEWIPALSQIKQQIYEFSGIEFNSVLANLYRDGEDSMGWHADNEKSLGINPVIASLSFGAERLFKLHHKKNHQAVDIKLEHGSLLIMSGSLQHHWRHCLPKTRRQVTPRINLTFRHIVSGSH